MTDSPNHETPGLMPAVFIGHGSPTNTLEQNRYTEAWARVGSTVPRPRAVLCVSAHWYVQLSAVTAMARPPVIHDFYGFGEDLFAFDYPAPGSPELAEEIVELARPDHVGLDRDSWGLDHGTWSVLAHMFPDADIPVVQLSVHALEDTGYHVELGRRLAPLRDRGVMIVGSGNVVHNLRRMDPSLDDQGFDWAVRFDEHVRSTMRDDPAALVDAPQHPDYRLAVPTPDHFLPLLPIAGAAAAAGSGARVLVDGYQYGSLSMTAYTVGLDPAESHAR